MNNQYSVFLEKAAEELDISPSKYKQAVSRYQAVGAWLEGGEYDEQLYELCIYPQGSFRLGTVVRPYRNHKDQDYDIDLVCELRAHDRLEDAGEVKRLVGDRIKESERYRQMLEKEGKRCWTLNYAEQDGIGFHIDLLPAVPDASGASETKISITSQTDNGYEWCSSDPKGYSEWFKHRNQIAYQREALRQKRAIALNFRDTYASIEDVPDVLVRTPLQRAIQILKRHRDVIFSEREDWKCAPISMIITTIAAHLYGNESDVYSALRNMVARLDAHLPLLRGASPGIPDKAVIQRGSNGYWYIGNPVNQEENFADRWHEDNNARAKAFFQWVEALKSDFIEAASLGENAFRNRMSSLFGETAVSKHLASAPRSVGKPTIRTVSVSEAPKPWRVG